MLSKFKGGKKKKEKRARKGEKMGEPEREQQGEKGRKGQQAHTALLSFTSENVKKKKPTIALRLQQPTAYKPMSEKSCQTVFHTEYSDPLSHRPAVQCTALQTVLLWRKLVVPMCKLLYQEGDKLGSSHCPYPQGGGAEQSASLSPIYGLLFKESIFSFSVEQLKHLFWMCGGA